MFSQVDSSISNVIVNPKSHQHIALLYDGKDELNAQIAECLNDGLKRGQFCVYATVHFRDDGLLPEQNEAILSKGNLVNGGDQH